MAELNAYSSLDEASDQQTTWFWRYLANGFRATEAARFAKYADPGQSGWENKQRFANLIAEKMRGAVMSAEEALAGLSEIARSSLDELTWPAKRIKDKSLFDLLFEEDPGDPDAVPPPPEFEEYAELSLESILANGKGHLVRSFGYDRNGNPKVSLHDALKARIEILKIQGAYKARDEEADDGELGAIMEALEQTFDTADDARAHYAGDDES